MRLLLAILAAAFLCAGGCGRSDPARDSKLLTAVKEGDAQAAHDLLDAGANVEARNESGRTPLMLAALKSNAEMVKLLLDHNADATARDSSGMTALMWAAFGGSADSVKLLIKTGAEIKAKDNMGKTAKDWAAPNKPEVARLLAPTP